MTLKEALVILNALLKGKTDLPADDIRAAINLGINAILQVGNDRQRYLRYRYLLLPGEIEDSVLTSVPLATEALKE